MLERERERERERDSWLTIPHCEEEQNEKVEKLKKSVVEIRVISCRWMLNLLFSSFTHEALRSSPELFWKYSSVPDRTGIWESWYLSWYLTRGKNRAEYPEERLHLEDLAYVCMHCMASAPGGGPFGSRATLVVAGVSATEFLRWLNTGLRAVSGNSRDGACFKLDKQTWRRKSNGTQKTIS